MFSFQSEASMLPTAGLHVSQPIESGLTPAAAMISGIVFNFLILWRDETSASHTDDDTDITTLKRSARDMAKCEHRLLLTAMPAFFNSVYTYPTLGNDQARYKLLHTFTMFVMSGIPAAHCERQTRLRFGRQRSSVELEGRFRLTSSTPGSRFCLGLDVGYALRAIFDALYNLALGDILSSGNASMSTI